MKKMKKRTNKKAAVLLAVLVGFMSPFIIKTIKTSAAPSNEYFDWGTSAKTQYGDAADNHTILSGDYNGDGVQDMYIIDRKGDSKTTEVHVLDGKSGYKTYTAHIATAMKQTDDKWAFLLNDYNADGYIDIYCLNRAGDNDSTEIKILNGKDKFQSFILENKTCMRTTNGNDFDFDLGDYNKDCISDLYIINKNGGSNTTEIHILDGATGFTTFMGHSVTALGVTDGDYEFELGNYNIDDILDLIVIKENNDNGKAEIIVLDGQSMFKNMIFRAESVLGKTDGTYDFGVNKFAVCYPDIYIYAKNPSSGKIEMNTMRFIKNGHPVQTLPDVEDKEYDYSTFDNISKNDSSDKSEVKNKTTKTKESKVVEEDDENTSEVTGDAKSIIAKAESQLGIKEKHKWTKYGAWWDDKYNTGGYARAHWCAMFVSWCGNKSGISEKKMGCYAYCPSWVNWFRKKDIWKSRKSGYTPKTGDIIFFDWNRDGTANHVGLVEYSKGSKVHTIEGNADDMVKRRSYSKTYGCILGYGVPNY